MAPNRLYLVIALVAAILPWSWTARGSDSPSPWPADRTVLIVSADHAYPPYEYLDDGRPTGFNIELIQAVADILGLPIELRLGPWQAVKHDLETGRADILAGMYYSDDRARTFGFSVPHTMVSSGLFVRDGSTIKSLDDLRGRRVLVQKGDIMHDHLLAASFASKVVPVMCGQMHINSLVASAAPGFSPSRQAAPAHPGAAWPTRPEPG
ncbi:transporter substrate-binding domain-containing protein [Desulfonatronum parangueonense]